MRYAHAYANSIQSSAVSRWPWALATLREWPCYGNRQRLNAYN
ncbi:MULTISPECIES: hypothetical protein [Moorena]|nr:MULTISPECIES: hypothetical protein [Moorena]